MLNELYEDHWDYVVTIHGEDNEGNDREIGGIDVYLYAEWEGEKNVPAIRFLSNRVPIIQ